MKRRKIEELIIKFLNNSINEKEWEELNQWSQFAKDDKDFYDYLEIKYAIEIILDQFNAEGAKKSVVEKIRRDKAFALRKSLLRYAAAVSILLTSAYFIVLGVQDNHVEQVPELVETKIEHGTDKAILTLGDGSEVVLAKGEKFKNQNVDSNGEEIVYESSNPETGEVVYNYLTIPRGGQFRIVLADGTQVWLNSESRLKYPEYFIGGQLRQVELVYGEAYFDVSPSEDNEGSKFKVLHKSQEIEVFGTEFNLKAYSDETNIYTTLVEGKVAVNSEGNISFLKPSDQLNFNTETRQLTISQIDVYNEISWKDGIFTFERMPLKDVVKVLSRWYDIEFVFENAEAKEKKFNGSLKRNHKIEDILNVIKDFEKIESYEVIDKTITIK